MSERDPESTLKVLEDQALEDEMGETAAMSDEDLAAALRAEGLDPEAARAGGDKIADRAATLEAGLAAPRPVRPSRAVWLAAAAVLLLVVGAIGLTEGAAIVAWIHGTPEPITPASDMPRPPTPRETAEKLRDEADRACQEQEWGPCNDKLDEAKKLDPAGESQARVKGLREAIREGTTYRPEREKKQ